MDIESVINRIKNLFADDNVDTRYFCIIFCNKWQIEIQAQIELQQSGFFFRKF